MWKWDANRGERGEAVVMRCDYFTRDPETGKEVDWYRFVLIFWSQEHIIDGVSTTETSTFPSASGLDRGSRE